MDVEAAATNVNNPHEECARIYLCSDGKVMAFLLKQNFYHSVK